MPTFKADVSVNFIMRRYSILSPLYGAYSYTFAIKAAVNVNVDHETTPKYMPNPQEAVVSINVDYETTPKYTHRMSDPNVLVVYFWLMSSLWSGDNIS